MLTVYLNSKSGLHFIYLYSPLRQQQTDADITENIFADLPYSFCFYDLMIIWI